MTEEMEETVKKKRDEKGRDEETEIIKGEKRK